METITVPGRASTAVDLVSGDAAEAGPIIVSGIVIVKKTVQIVGAVGVGPIIVRSMVKSERAKRGMENSALETEKGREHVNVRRSLCRLFCYHVLGTSSPLIRRGLHLLGCEYFVFLKCLKDFDCKIDKFVSGLQEYIN
jgi:hypothetical protein